MQIYNSINLIRDFYLKTLSKLRVLGNKRYWVFLYLQWNILLHNLWQWYQMWSHCRIMLIALLNALFIKLIYWEFCCHHILWFGYYFQIGNRQQLVLRFQIQIVWINDFDKPLSTVLVCFYCLKYVFNQF